MAEPTDFIGKRRLSALVESRHSIASGNTKPLYRLELRDVTDCDTDARVWQRKTVSDGKKWDEVPTGSKVTFDARLDFDRNNRVQIFGIKNVEVEPADGSPWWKLW